jgi:nicotinamide riboside kinase
MQNTHKPVDAIYIIGPSSTGKTTLCKALAEHLNLEPELWVQEVARTVMKQTGFSRHTIGLTEMQLAILVAQVEREREARVVQARLHAGCGVHKIILNDTSAIDPIIYTYLFSPTTDEAEQRRKNMFARPEFQEVLSRYKSSSSRFFLLEPVPEWVEDDGVRSLDDHERCLSVFMDTLQQLGINYEVIGGEIMDLKVRMAKVVAVLNERVWV